MAKVSGMVSTLLHHGKIDLAVIWTKNNNGKTYQVRTAGNSVRLYTNGVFHSQYNPKRPFSGQVWDLLSLPSLFFNRDKKPKRILLLGVGGGAAIKQLIFLNNPKTLYGVELDKTHLSIAKRFFKVNNSKSIKLFHEDAIKWVNEYQGEKFDYIVDDLFSDYESQPARAINADSRWMKKLDRLLSIDGILVCNFADKEELSDSGYFTNKALKKRFACAFQLSTPHTYNRIAIFCKKTLTANSLKNNIRQEAKANPTFSEKELRFAIRKLK